VTLYSVNETDQVTNLNMTRLQLL